MNEKVFDKIIGYTTVKKELAQIADCLLRSDSYAEMGVYPPRGLLLFGEPGVGKSLMADCLIEASGRPVVVCRKTAPDGEFVKAIKESFDEAAAAAPSVILLDDMDKFANGDSRHPDAEEYVTVQSCIDECRGKNVFVLATANNVRNLPKSLLRAGRFDRRIEVIAPEGADAEAIIAHYLKNKPCAAALDPAAIARIMNGKSCAELETVINEAGLLACYDRAPAITMRHFLLAALRVVYHIAGSVPEEGDLFALPEVKSHLRDGRHATVQVAYHEAGHAAVAELLEPGSVSLVTLYGDEEDGHISGFVIHNRRKSDPCRCAYNDVRIGLGGKAALDTKFGIADLGTGDDLDHAYSRLREILSCRCPDDLTLHADDTLPDSEDMKFRQEVVLADGINREYRAVKRLLAMNREFLDKLAAALAEKHILTSDDVRAIRESCDIVTGDTAA